LLNIGYYEKQFAAESMLSLRELFILRLVLKKFDEGVSVCLMNIDQVIHRFPDDSKDWNVQELNELFETKKKGLFEHLRWTYETSQIDFSNNFGVRLYKTQKYRQGFVKMLWIHNGKIHTDEYPSELKTFQLASFYANVQNIKDTDDVLKIMTAEDKENKIYIHFPHLILSPLDKFDNEPDDTYKDECRKFIKESNIVELFNKRTDDLLKFMELNYSKVSF
jgi:hypothetical protein